jgi:hypothetical protein
MTDTPQAAVARLIGNPTLPAGDGERFAAYGVMGTPMSGGHYLVLRDMVATSIGPGYRAVWHRSPDGAWVTYTTTAPELSCPRYFGAEAAYERVNTIDVDWLSPWQLRVRMDDRLDWRIELGGTVATRLMSSMGAAMPAAAWRSDAVLATMGPAARPLLRVGRIRLAGRTPNRQHFQAAPVRIWSVTGGRAVLDGAVLRAEQRAAEQPHLADFWMPRRGVFTTGHATFETLDPARHYVVPAAADRARP